MGGEGWDRLGVLGEDGGKGVGKCIHDTLALSGVHRFVHSLAEGTEEEDLEGQVQPLNQPKLAAQSGLWLSFPPDSQGAKSLE